MTEVDPSWDRETKRLAHRLAAVGHRWQEVNDERDKLRKERVELFHALRERGVRNLDIARLAGVNRGVIDTMFSDHKRAAASS